MTASDSLASNNNNAALNAVTAHGKKHIRHPILDSTASRISWRASVELQYAVDPDEVVSVPTTRSVDITKSASVKECLSSPSSSSCSSSSTSALSPQPPSTLLDKRYCSYCKKESKGALLKACGRCLQRHYCSRECQALDWKTSHKHMCSSYQHLTVNPLGIRVLRESADLDAIKASLYAKIRLYAGPYAVHQFRIIGRGFLFVQCTVTLATISLNLPLDVSSGRPLPERRSVLLHFLTLGEYDRELCREDFELATLRTPLQEAITSYDPNDELVMLMRFRCGHLAVGVANLVPKYSACLRLGQDYFRTSGNNDPLQLDLDEQQDSIL